MRWWGWGWRLGIQSFSYLALAPCGSIAAFLRSARGLVPTIAFDRSLVPSGSRKGLLQGNGKIATVRMTRLAEYLANVYSVDSFQSNARITA